ncbi:MAG: hypothetical protein AAFY25_08055 [Pseudomonadota bacterium]
MRTELVLSDELFPVQSFFNALDDTRLERALIAFASGHGFNPEDRTCDFPADLAEDEGGPAERFNYIEFWTYVGNEETRISFDQFLKILDEVVAAQIKADQQNAAKWEKSLSAVHDAVRSIAKRTVLF